MGTRATEDGYRLLVCEVVAAPEAPGDVLLVPWGRVTGAKGDFIVNEQSAREIEQVFQAQGVDLPIDYEHHTVGGEFSSPDGTAPAAGWIKALKVVPGEGIIGRVEWTPRAAEMVSGREYRYLSPVVFVDKDTLQAVELHSVALTNKPAIKGFPALINKQNVSNGKDDAMNEIIAAIEKLIASVQAGDMPAEDISQALAAILVKLQAAEEGGEEGGEEGEGGTTTSTNSERLAMCENARLRGKLADQEYERVMLANSGRIPPAQQDSCRRWWGFDREGAESFLKAAPVLVNKQRTSTGGGGQAGKVGRAMVIREARATFAANAGEKALVCSERAWVSTALRDAGHSTLTEEETRQHGIQAAAV